VAVDNGNVYAAGFDDATSGTVWKNGAILYQLSNSGTFFSVVIVGSDVYMAGSESVSGTTVGRVWKNGIADTGYADARSLRSVFIDGNDVYAAGITISKDAAVWKNGTLLYTFTAGDGTHTAYSVVVDSGDVYTAGYINTGIYYAPTLWKNNTLFYTLEAGDPYYSKMELRILNGDNYVAGYNTKKCGGTVWKNGGATNGGQTIETRIGSALCNAYSVFVSNNGDLYVAGEVSDCGNYAAAAWEKGKGDYLSPGWGTAWSIVVGTVNNSGSNNGGDVNVSEIADYKPCVYPNPTTGKLSVVSSQLSEMGGKVEIYDIVGQVVFVSATSSTSPETVIDISHLSAGLYFLKVDGKIFKVVKE